MTKKCLNWASENILVMKYIVLFLFVLAGVQMSAQELTKFTVKVDKDRLDAPVAIDLGNVNYNVDKGNLVLFEIKGNDEIPVVSQIETGHSARLWFILKGESPAGSERSFVLKLDKKNVHALITPRGRAVVEIGGANPKNIARYGFAPVEKTNGEARTVDLEKTVHAEYFVYVG